MVIAEDPDIFIWNFLPPDSDSLLLPLLFEGGGWGGWGGWDKDDIESVVETLGFWTGKGGFCGRIGVCAGHSFGLTQVFIMVYEKKTNDINYRKCTMKHYYENFSTTYIFMPRDTFTLK